MSDALTRQPGDTADLIRQLRAIARINGRARQLDDKLQALYTERARLLVEARRLDPPVSWARLAQVCQVTPAAIVQVVNKATADTPPG